MATTPSTPVRDHLLAELSGRGSVIRDLGVRRLGLFGSFARGDAKAESDLDFLVEFREGAKSFDNYMDLKFLLEDLSGRAVDLVIAENVKSRLRPSILEDLIDVQGI